MSTLEMMCISSKIISMKIFIGGDHAGFELKSKLVEFLKSEGYDVTDFGPHELNPGDDYSDFVIPVAKAVAGNPLARGIIIGGSGQGEVMAANRFSNVRAAEYYGGNLEIIRLSREHNDANVLSLGARFVSEQEAQEAITLWLQTPFSSDERHHRRIAKIEEGNKK